MSVQPTDGNSFIFKDLNSFIFAGFTNPFMYYDFDLTPYVGWIEIDARPAL